MIDVIINGLMQGEQVECIKIEGFTSIREAFDRATKNWIVPMYQTMCDYVYVVIMLHTSQEPVGRIWADRKTGKITGRRFV